jgi:sugar lactone lactonase YvrE
VSTSRACRHRSTWRDFAGALIAGIALGPIAAQAPAELLYFTEANNLRRLDIESFDAGHPRSEIFVEHARSKKQDPERFGYEDPRRRDMNGMVCALPGGGFVNGEDTEQSSPPPGWGIFDDSGHQIGKLATTYFVEQGEPYGCAVDGQGRLFTTSLGNVGFGSPKGQVVLWFPPFARFPGPPGAFPRTDAISTDFCKLAVDIGNALGVALDAKGRLYVASSGRGSIYRFSPPFPTSSDAAGGCGSRDPSGVPMADAVDRETFFAGLYTFSGLAFAPGGNLYAASVFTGEILEIDPDGNLVRKLLDPDGLLPPFDTGSPMGLAVDSKGRVYYADMDLSWDFPDIGPGENGKVRRIAFDAKGDPQPPEILIEGLGFPDGLGILPGSLAPEAGD